MSEFEQLNSATSPLVYKTVLLQLEQQAKTESANFNQSKEKEQQNVALLFIYKEQKT